MGGGIATGKQTPALLPLPLPPGTRANWLYSLCDYQLQSFTSGLSAPTAPFPAPFQCPWPLDLKSTRRTPESSLHPVPFLAATCTNPMRAEFMYRALDDHDLSVRKNAVMVLTHLILNDMMKVGRRVGRWHVA